MMIKMVDMDDDNDGRTANFRPRPDIRRGEVTMTANPVDDKFPDLAGPIEYKDAPVRFTLVLNGREEPVKIVEPQIDLPLPEGCRLLVDEGTARICDIVFRFEADARKPYRLHFKTFKMQPEQEGRQLAYGTGGGRKSNMRAAYRKTIVSRGNIRAHIEMTEGKARLLIRYRKGYRIPPDQPKQK
jgi:hypothetical protein